MAKDSRTGDMTDIEIFDRMAPGWYGFRHRTIFRQELEDLAKRWRSGTLLNIGCGHGADFPPFKGNFRLYGVDFSAGMLGFARKYADKFEFDVDLVQAGATYLPFRDNTFSWAIAVATYHHLRSRQEREMGLAELKRVLKPGGEAFITVWNRWQPRFWFSGKDTLVPWRTGGETLYRYYHLFSYRELERLVKQAGFQMLKSFPEYSYRLPIKAFPRNICLLLKKA